MGYRSVLVAASVSSCALTAANHPSANTSNTPQCANLWSRPETLRTKTGAFVDIARPVGVIPSGNGFSLFGPHVLLVPPALDTSAVSRDLRDFDPSITLGGTVAPGGLTQFVKRPEFIRATSNLWTFPDGPNRFHLIWGVPRDSSKPDGLDVSSVWYSRFDGRDWSKPELVMKASRLRWWHSISAVALTKDLIVVAAPAVDSAWIGIVASYRTSSGWVTDRFTTRAGLPPAGVAVTISEGRALLFYRDDTTSTGVSGSGIYVRELATNGSGWRSERLLHPLGHGALNWPLALASRDHRVHVFWAYTGVREAVETLEHLSSTDLRTWRLDRLPIRAQPIGFNIAAAGDSSIQVVLQTDLFAGIASTLWTPKGFSPIEELRFAMAIGSAPNLASLPSGRLMMTWTGEGRLEFQKTVVPFPVTIYSSRAERCRCAGNCSF